MKLIKGFKDIYPLSDKVVENTSIFNSVKEIVTEIAKRYNFQEIITPVIENKDTFTTGIGSDTDIVSKEMYDFYASLPAEERRRILKFHKLLG